ncbi:MAG: hypothetical protein JWO30_958 [Fibrobacteres bacterium]|nr:hypothetical protein [Fibrobacterota bacterium]
MQKPSVDIFAYADFRKFLQDCAASLKRLDPKFSQRFIQDKVGASSSGWFADIVKGRIHLTGHMLLRLAQFLGLEPDQVEYFEALVDYQQAASAEEKSRRLEMLLDRKGIRMDAVGKEKFEFYGEWYHSAVREVLFFFRFKNEFASLAKKLEPAITTAQAKDSIRLLLALELIKPDEQGYLRPAASIIKKDGAVKAVGMKSYFRKKMELGMLALDRFEKEDRDVSCMTLSLSREAFETARKELQALRKKLLRLAEREQRPEHVYQINFQVFPITK